MYVKMVKCIHHLALACYFSDYVWIKSLNFFTHFAFYAVQNLMRFKNIASPLKANPKWYFDVYVPNDDFLLRTWTARKNST